MCEPDVASGVVASKGPLTRQQLDSGEARRDVWATVVAPIFNDSLKTFGASIPECCATYEMNPDINAKMHLPMKNFTASGNNDATVFNKFSHGDTVLNYMHTMYKDSQMLKDLINKELDAGAGAETGNFGGRAVTAPPGHDPESRRTASRAGAGAKRDQRERTSALTAMAASSASMASSSARRTNAAVVKDLTDALASAQAAKGSPFSIKSLERRIIEALAACDAEPPSSKRVRPPCSDDDVGSPGVDAEGGRAGRLDPLPSQATGVLGAAETGNWGPAGENLRGRGQADVVGPSGRACAQRL
ncbi:hypothetical protein I4F81_005183 [Pyropia yezoensis]|uniref:Uncharacterized protein n=1 Tax=Pyropia yezoensis TaxID=2788 RepID=A0ACC3BXJ6_PYRYE|nr:hypothetical protein I4F81_005183 [Neopyropia yezoensis]